MPSENLTDAPIVGAEPAGLWTHSDPGGVDDAAARGLERALSQDWTSGSLEERAADWQGYCVLSAWARGMLVGHVTPGEGVAIHVDTRVSADATPERAAAAAALQRTSVLIADRIGGYRDWTPPQILDTRVDVADTGVLPALAVAAIAIAGAAAVAYCAYQAAQVVDNYLARDQKLAEVVEADAQALKLVERHTEREAQEGRALPLDDASKAAFAELSDRQHELATQTTAPVGSGAPEVSVGGGFGLGLGIAVAALGAWLYVQR